MEFSYDIRRRAREICRLISSDSGCSDPEGFDPEREPCDGKTCYIFELLEMGKIGKLRD